MALLDWFSRSASASPPLDLRARLLTAVAAKDLRAVAGLFKDHRSTIRASFVDWSTVPMEMRRDEAGLARYGEMLIALARLFEQEGDEGPMAALRGDPAADPIEDWHRDIAAAQAAVDDGRHADAASMLSALLDRMTAVQGSAVDFYRPRVLGKLGIAFYQVGEIARALEMTREARDVCARIGDEDGVKAYTANLATMGEG